MQAVIRLTDGDVLAQSFIGTTPHGEYRCPGNAARKELLACAAAYDLAARYDQQSELYAIGRRLYDWLDQAGWASECCFAQTSRRSPSRRSVSLGASTRTGPTLSLLPRPIGSIWHTSSTP